MTIDILPLAATPVALHAPPGGVWSLAEYEHLPGDDGTRYEIVEGALHMAPAPNTGHQWSNNIIAFHLTRMIYFPGHGQVYTAPTDVELGPYTIVQPDVVVVLNGGSAQITPQRIVGAPDLVVEISSPSTAGYDRREKQDAYAAAGVREYWIADPANQTVELLVLDGARFRAVAAYTGQAVIPTTVVPGWDVPTKILFEA